MWEQRGAKLGRPADTQCQTHPSPSDLPARVMLLETLSESEFSLASLGRGGEQSEWCSQRLV